MTLAQAGIWAGLTRSPALTFTVPPIGGGVPIMLPVPPRPVIPTPRRKPITVYGPFGMPVVIEPDKPRHYVFGPLTSEQQQLQETLLLFGLGLATGSMLLGVGWKMRLAYGVGLGIVSLVAEEPIPTPFTVGLGIPAALKAGLALYGAWRSWAGVEALIHSVGYGYSLPLVGPLLITR